MKGECPPTRTKSFIAPSNKFTALNFIQQLFPIHLPCQSVKATGVNFPSCVVEVRGGLPTLLREIPLGRSASSAHLDRKQRTYRRTGTERPEKV